MRATPRAVAASLVVVVALILAACEPTPTPPVARDRAAAWLVNQFGADGVIAASFDPTLDDLGGTAYAVTNLAAAGVRWATARQAVAALARGWTSTWSTVPATISRGRWRGSSWRPRPPA